MSEPVSVGQVATALGVSVSWVRQLTEAGVLTATRTAGGHRRYDLPANLAAYSRHASVTHHPREVDAPPLAPAPGIVVLEETLAVSGLEEDREWRRLTPLLALDTDSGAYKVARYAFTEMLNNAIDHSSATQVRVRVIDDGALVFHIADDGVGAYAHLARGLGLADAFEAVAELSKGKRTTAPEQHTGEGIFFTSKAVDVFRLEANGLAWVVDNKRHDQALGSSAVSVGTTVSLRIARDTETDLAAVFRRFTRDQEFVRTSPVVRLFGMGVDFVSRSEAKRLLSGMEAFEEIVIDFAGVTSVGQAFVDEVFRVWPAAHPGKVIRPGNMSPEVTFMVERGLARAAEPNPQVDRP